MPHTAARAYEQRDSVQRRSHRPRHPPNHPRTLVSASEAASGLLTGLQGTDALASLSGSPYQATRTPDTHPRGWVRRAGSPPPCAASFFPYSFFAGEERIWPPEGASPLAWKKLRRKKPTSKRPRAAPKKRPPCGLPQWGSHMKVLLPQNGTAHRPRRGRGCCEHVENYSL